MKKFLSRFDPERLIKLREARNINQRELARKLGYKPSYLCDIEKGRVLPSFEFLYKCSKIMNVSLDWLLTGEGRPAKSKKDELMYYLENIGIKNKEDMESFLKILEGYLGLEAYQTLIALMEKRQKSLRHSK